MRIDIKVRLDKLEQNELTNMQALELYADLIECSLAWGLTEDIQEMSEALLRSGMIDIDGNILEYI